MRSLPVFAYIIFQLTIISCDTNSNKKTPVEIACQQKTDSLLSVNLDLKKKYTALYDSINSEQLSTKIKLHTLKGRFTDAYLADCFHLIFIDEKGKEYTFGNPDNINDNIILDTKGDVKLKKGISKKTYIITYANLKGIDCQSADSYYEEQKTYVRMPTIIDMEEVKN